VHRRGIPVEHWIGQVELAAGLQQPEHSAKHRRLVHRQVDHAVGDDDVEAFRSQIKLFQLLDVTLEEAHIAAPMSQALLVPAKMGLGGRKLLVGHVDAYDLTLWPRQLRQNVSVATGA
jgi:methylaspartate ammonia-lyase